MQNLVTLEDALLPVIHPVWPRAAALNKPYICLGHLWFTVCGLQFVVCGVCLRHLFDASEEEA